MVFNQYINYHNEYQKKYGKNTVVFMQVGSFFELYGIYQDDKIIGCDVIKISEILNVQYTKKNKKNADNIMSNPWMCGFPDHSLSKFRNVLLNNNYTIVLVEQVTNPPNPEREVTEIISPGTIVDSYNKSATNNILSIYITKYTDYKSHKEVFVCGLSVIDIGTGECHVMEARSIPDDLNLYIDETYRFIHTYNPIEIIIHLSDDVIELSDNNKNNDFSLENSANIKSHKFTKQWFINVFEIISPNVYINNITGDQYTKVPYQNQFLEKVYKECGMLSPIEYIDMECMPDALISFLYLLQFAYEHKDNIIQNIKKPDICNVYNHLILSNNAIQQLNVYDNFNNYSGRFNSLYNIVCKCKTPIGKRLLKNRLLSPIIDPEELNNRYDLIDFFQQKTSNDYKYNKYQNILQKIQDIDKIQRLMGLGKLQPDKFHTLDNSYTIINKLINTLNEDFTDDDKIKSLFNRIFPELIHSKFNKYVDTYTKELNIPNMDKYSHKDNNLTDISFFNRNIHPDIDSLQDEIDTIVSTINKYIQYFSAIIDQKKPKTFKSDDKDSNVKPLMLKLEYSEKHNWYIVLTKKRSELLLKRLETLKYNKNNMFNVCNLDLEKDKLKFISISNSAVKLYYKPITDKLTRLYVAINNIKSLVLEKYFTFIKDLFCKYNDVFTYLSSLVGNIDFYACGARVAIENSYTRPIVDLGSSSVEDNDISSYISVKGLRHPIVEKIQSDLKYITNDINIGGEGAKNGILLFGTNACGKSTLMKAIGLNIVLAQTGFFTSTTYMKFCPYQQLFTRILNNDNIFKSQSSFAVEMSELRGILKRCNKRSIILGDELCSGTESISAISIVSAGIHRLSTDCVNFIFASHLHSLTDLPIIRDIDNLAIYHLKVIFSEISGQLTYDRTLTPGSGPSIYGLEVCRAMGLDLEFIRVARKVQLELTDKTSAILSDKKSIYTTQMYMDKCEVCSADAIDTHHIAEQHTADENGMIEHYHKNNKFNLVALCKDCHHNVHHGNLEISGYKLTSLGIKLQYKYNTIEETLIDNVIDNTLVEETLVEETFVEETFIEETLIDNTLQFDTAGGIDIEIPIAKPISPVKTNPNIIIQSGNISRKKFNKAKRDIILGYKDNYKSYKGLIETLFSIHDIKIGSITLKKILNNTYCN